MNTPMLSALSLWFLATPVIQPVPPTSQDPVIYVDDNAPLGGDGLSWATAYRSLHAALSNAPSEGTIHIGPGVYKPDDSNRSVSFSINKRLTIIGGFGGLNFLAQQDTYDPSLHKTILSGDLLGNDTGILDPSQVDPYNPDPTRVDNSHRIVSIDTSAGGPVDLKGLTIQSGYSENGGVGSAVYIDASSVAMEDITLLGNYSEWGGALYCDDGSWVTGTACTISNNCAASSGGAIYLDWTTHCDYGDPYYGGCDSGCCYHNASSISLYKTILKNNHSLVGAGGAIAGDGSYATLRSCIVDSNFAYENGGALAMYYADGSGQGYEQVTHISNCTFESNISVATGANIYISNYGMGLKIENSVFWDSQPTYNHIYFPNEGEYVLDNNIIEGGIYGPMGPGNNNLDVNPNFTDSLGHINAFSPSVEAGKMLNFEVYDQDADGNPRVALSLPDIGAFEFQPDCNASGTPDIDDISSGFSLDCNGNQIPDECEITWGSSSDCNADGVLDSCSLADGTSQDCNENSVPDNCELAGNDCNSNGILDSCEWGGSKSEDCDNNGIPDPCELSNNDCNANGTLDACDVISGGFVDCDDNYIPDECELLGNDCDSNGIPDQCDAEGIDCNSNGVPDYCELSGNDCDNNTVPDDCQSDCNGDLVPDACEPDCDGDGLPDWCETASEEGDCNANGLPDNCDIAAGTSTDLNHNLTPDECDPDCNENDLPDFIDIAYGVSQDCNTNEIPDECDVSSGTSNDCNGNGVPDECDTSDSSSLDCNSNSIPDECEDDCNRNGVPDDCDIASGTSLDLNEDGHPDDCKPDCNGNGVPDYIDILFSASQDCDLNGIPDECEADCNQNGVLDLCDLSDGTSSDCDANSTPDECDPDCDQDGTPDNCQTFTDCNANGSPDDCDILTQASDDCDGNSTPDECDLADGADDCDENDVLDICQIAADPNADLNGNGTLDTCECFATNFCEGVVNSSGTAGSIGIIGSTIISQNDLNLTATGVPANQFGVFYYGPNQVNGGLGTPFGEGRRCVGGQTVRLNVVNTGNDSSAVTLIDNTTAPHSQNLQAGSTWNFQFWFRDTPGGPFGWNLTDALSITFCP